MASTPLVPASTNYEANDNQRAQVQAAACVANDDVAFLGPVPAEAPGRRGPPGAASRRAVSPWTLQSGAPPVRFDRRPVYAVALPVRGGTACVVGGAASGGWASAQHSPPQALPTQSYSRQVDNHTANVGTLSGNYALARPDRSGWSVASQHAGLSIAQPPPIVQSQTWTAADGAASLDLGAGSQWSRHGVGRAWGLPVPQLAGGAEAGSEKMFPTPSNWSGPMLRRQSGGQPFPTSLVPPAPNLPPPPEIPCVAPVSRAASYSSTPRKSSDVLTAEGGSTAEITPGQPPSSTALRPTYCGTSTAGRPPSTSGSVSLPPPAGPALPVPSARRAAPARSRGPVAPRSRRQAAAADEQPFGAAAVASTRTIEPLKRTVKRKATPKDGDGRPPKAVGKGSPSVVTTAVILIEAVDMRKMSPSAKIVVEAVLTALAPTCAKQDRLSNDVAELKGDVKLLKKGADTQGHLCQRVASDVAVMSTTKIDLTKSDDGRAAAKPAATAMEMAVNNDKTMAVSRRFFKRSYKKNMAKTESTSGFFKGPEDTLEFLISCVMESHEKSEEQAFGHLLAVQKFPNQAKDDTPEYRVRKRILRSQNHLTEGIRSAVMPAYLSAVGIDVWNNKKDAPAPTTKKCGKRAADSRSKTAGRASLRAKVGPVRGLRSGSKRRSPASKQSSASLETQKNGGDQAATLESRAMANEWLKDDAYARSEKGWDAFLAGMEALIYFLGAEDRFVEPSKVGEARYIACPLGYPVLVGAFVRSSFEKVAGRRPMRPSGTTEGFYKDYV